MDGYEAPRGTLLLMLVFFLLLVLIWSVVFLNLLGREIQP
jgi:hypothetical protein